VRLRTQIAVLILMLSAGCADAMASLPPHEAPVRHWPLWLRILAVIGVLLFVQMVARSLRGGAGGRPPNSGGNQHQ
jgi:hypothetical protein